ncbi:bifunctional hydroxymethylpyrimidine kinase/phosphomethylpyrimidine kinase [Caulobacter sp. S45]|uniref:bifunctional hydroxymethylpyrimidine kinase/phosphomethylpyrimidine kinase n=1 Tax=Caulobacter sp. S45 TaxID=1641861 RepID=UPI001575FF9B|nr:bifunctional hydroxymethylpyrimidine kinase/phosphomethylpyrimidine kinase [Caulobacter sp. S45]
MHEHRGRVLVIAGSDSGGGAGLQADVKTITMLGGYASTAVTAVTVQNTLGVHAVFAIPPDIVRAQGRVVLEDIGADAVKVGMLGDATLVEVAAELIDAAGEAPAVIDPVMVAKGGASLASDVAVQALRTLLIPRAALLTPNAPEAEALTGREVRTPDHLHRAGEALLEAGARAVLVKGGHLPGERLIDVLVTPYGETRFEGGRIHSRHTHGTGCTLASAVAARLAQGWPLEPAVAAARDYVREAIRAAPGLGGGHGPLHHGWPLGDPADPPEATEYR